MWKFNYEKIKLNGNWNLDIALKLIAQKNGTLLYSSPDSGEAMQIILGFDPLATISSKTDSLAKVDSVISQNTHIDFPFIFGYLGYDSKHLFEEAGVYKNLIDSSFELYSFHVYRYVVVFSIDWKLQASYELLLEKRSTNISKQKKFLLPNDSNFSGFKVEYQQSDLNREEFIYGVERIKEYIKAGDVYQVNLTRKVSCRIEGDKLAAAKALIQSNRIEFGVFYKHDDKYLISTSPERFFSTENGRILVSPIKGTAGRIENDDTVKNELLNDTKNLRELAMITDLLRNDISRICYPGSVKVKGFPILKTLRNVYHLVSDIEGKLCAKRFSEIVNALFPGGSITGCPKIRACQIIEELENKGRGLYTGSFGYISGHGKMDFNILIRTVLIENDQLIFNVGGGITLLSDPEDEYLETIHKAKNIVEALRIDNFFQKKN